MAYALAWLADIAREAGLKVAEDPGWQGRGHADIGTVRGIVCHHTASNRRSGNAPALGIVRSGRRAGPGTTALAGPLANCVLARDGTVIVVAAGLAYHAGPGRWQGVTDGNSRMIGIEAENDGIGEPWPEVQLDAYARLCAGLLDRIGAPTLLCCGHKEWTTRKIDPAGIDMDAFRARIAGIRNGAPVRAPIPAADRAGRPTLRRGASGAAVTALQAAIGVPADGAFGPATEAALRAWQRARGLVPDGIAGPAVWGVVGHAKAAA